MIKKTVLFSVFVILLSVNTAFAGQIDSLSSRSGPVPPTQIYVNPAGTGDALIYGYYNVRDENNTFFTITNTDETTGVRARLRFREAATMSSTLPSPICDNGGHEVAEMDICLGPGDVWTGILQADETTGAVRLFSNDSDTYVILAPAPAPANFFSVQGLLFKFGANNTVPQITADNTKEGYFEVIAERTLFKVTSGGNCGPFLTDIPLTDLGNVLMGHAYIVNLSNTATFAYSATALADFSVVAIPQTANDIGSSRPNLRDNSEDGTINPVNYALTKNKLKTVYDLEASIDGKTEMIVTFPTKILTHNSSSCLMNDDIFDDTRIGISIFDDQGNVAPLLCQFECPLFFSPRLPHAVNVFKINGNRIFTSDVEAALPFIIESRFDFGWILLDVAGVNFGLPPAPAHLTTFGNQTKLGLPAIGYVAHQFSSGKFSGLIPLQYTNAQE